MENTDIAQVFSQVADLLELTGGNAFRARAYRQAAQLLAYLPSSVAELWRQHRLGELPALGERLQGHIEELLSTGHFREYDRLLAHVPPGILELLQIEGVGPKTAALAWKRLHVHDLEGFEAACRSGALAALPRMGPQRVAGILAALERYRHRRGRVPLHRALATAETLTQKLRQLPGVMAAEVAGSLRRRRETVGDLDLLVAAQHPEPVLETFAHWPEVKERVALGPTKCTVRLQNGLSADLRVLPPGAFGAALHYFTGSKAHNIELRTRAVRQGIKISEYGVFDRTGRQLGGATEDEVFHAVGLPYIPPELREGRGEIQAALLGTLPKLVELADLQGDLHVHSRASTDARASVEELHREAARLGRRYLALTDHSKSRPRGLDARRMRAHAEAIRRFDHWTPSLPTLLAGVEVDILADGQLDLPWEVLAELDWVVASVHSHFTLPREAQTRRIVRAIRSGVVDVLGHPSGRQLGARDPMAFDFDEVLEVAREEGVALELNAVPDRLDVDDAHCRVAKEAGVLLALSSDAHHATQLENLRYGVWVARRGWLTAQDILNTRPLSAIRRHRAERRARKTPPPFAEPSPTPSP